MMSSESIESENPSTKSGPLSGISSFFYTTSNLITALLATFIFAGYLLFFLMGQSKAFEVAGSSVRSLGTSLGFGQAEILAFLAERSDQMIRAYIDFNQVWDTLFGLIYVVILVGMLMRIAGALKRRTQR